jgi:hypothetical protein
VALPSVDTLIPDLRKLRDQLTPSMDDVIYRDVHFRLELLPYCLGASAVALENLISEIQKISSGCLSSEPPDSRTIKIPEPAAADRLKYHVDHFLDAGRRAQNAWICYLSRRFSTSASPPSSLSELVNKLNRVDYGFHENVRRELTEYWEHHGRRLKDYRDLAQHFGLVLSEPRVFYADDGTPSIWLTLPNNPEVKSPTQLKFEDPTVHAFCYIRNQYCELMAFSYRLCTMLIESPANNVAPIAFVPRTWIRLGESPPSGHPIPVESAVAKEISERITAIHAQGEG